MCQRPTRARIASRLPVVLAAAVAVEDAAADVPELPVVLSLVQRVAARQRPQIRRPDVVAAVAGAAVAAAPPSPVSIDRTTAARRGAG